MVSFYHTSLFFSTCTDINIIRSVKCRNRSAPLTAVSPEHMTKHIAAAAFSCYNQPARIVGIGFTERGCAKSHIGVSK